MPEIVAEPVLLKPLSVALRAWKKPEMTVFPGCDAAAARSALRAGRSMKRKTSEPSVRPKPYTLKLVCFSL